LDDTVSSCPYCGNDVVDDLVDEGEDDVDAEPDDLELDDEVEGPGANVDLEDSVLLYRSFSRVNTDFLTETLKSARIPFHCRIIGGLYGRGMPSSVGFFGTRAVDAEIFVPREFRDEALEVKRQTVGDE
jgi:hypothetical protein